MPTYDLRCPGCSHEEELFSFTIILDLDKDCPVCKDKLVRKISAVATIFKGSGFYATEYGKSKGNAYTKDKKEVEEREAFIEQAKKDAGI